MLNMKISSVSGNFPDNPENFQTIWKFSRRSGNFPVQFQGLRAKTFRTRKNFPDGNATLPPRFLGLRYKPYPHQYPNLIDTRTMILRSSASRASVTSVENKTKAKLTNILNQGETSVSSISTYL